MKSTKQTLVTDSREKHPNAQTFKERGKELERLNKKDREREKRENNGPYSNFIQFNNSDEAYEREMKLIENPNAYKVWRFLCKHMDYKNALIVSYSTLQEIFGVSRTTMYRSIKFLTDHDYVRTYKTGTSNVYLIDDGLVWKSWGKNRKYSEYRKHGKYSEFTANVVISENEQSKEMKKEIETITKTNKTLELKE